MSQQQGDQQQQTAVQLNSNQQEQQQHPSNNQPPNSTANIQQPNTPLNQSQITSQQPTSSMILQNTVHHSAATSGPGGIPSSSINVPLQHQQALVTQQQNVVNALQHAQQQQQHQQHQNQQHQPQQQGSSGLHGNSQAVNVSVPQNAVLINQANQQQTAGQQQPQTAGQQQSMGPPVQQHQTQGLLGYLLLHYTGTSHCNVFFPYSL